MDYIKQPQLIEQHSFEIISGIIAEERPEYRFVDPLQEKIIKRAIHTTADFDWLDILAFSPDALDAITDALMQGCTLYTDTTMALSGINKSQLQQMGCQINCFVAHPDVAEIAKQNGITRSMAAVDLAMQQPGNKLFIFGNAPTALFRLLEISKEQPALRYPVIGVPVGFVGAAESKQALTESQLPYIAALGRKGGSNVAAAIVNAILYHLREAQ
ncbi:cobalt-precorrin-8 methylmutase [Tolumonas auensis]|uniref:cobalt-precorrin-8 methylmutase n=1 Tax=Tolumonas auensis TaxID=43948 RepID=UPI002AA65D10|nr:cobalt-precorrin-8 methylmutase [Tolumonas auensis]